MAYPPPSESEGERVAVEQKVYQSPNSFRFLYSTPQPMEVDGELPSSTNWEYHERHVLILPQIQLVQQPYRLVNLPHRPAQGLRLAQIARRTSESSSARQHHRPNSRSPHRQQDIYDRRGSNPRLKIASRRPMVSPSPSSRSESSNEGEERAIGKRKKRKPTGPHSNKPYTQEQFHWLWYHCEDRGLRYAEMYAAWDIQFPGEHREPGQAFCSRLYREAIYPRLDDDGELLRGRDGKLQIVPIGKRQRHTPQFKDFPFKLWEHSPEWALYWDWVLPEHKVIARKVLEARGLDDAQLRKSSHNLKFFTNLAHRKGKVTSSNHAIQGGSTSQKGMVCYASSPRRRCPKGESKE